MIMTRQFLRLQRTALLVWGAILVLMAFGVTSATPAVTQNNTSDALIKMLGPGLQALAGGDVTRFASPVDLYITMKLLMILPAIVGVYVVLATGAVVAQERSRGTLDFLLSLPVDRSEVLRQRFLGVMLGTGLLYVAIWLCLVGGLAATGMSGSYGHYALALLAAYMVNMAQAGLVLILSVAFLEYAQAIRWGLSFVLGTFLFSFALQSANVLSILRNMLLYGLSNPFPAVAEGRFPWAAAIVGLTGIALGLGWGGRIFARKELQ